MPVQTKHLILLFAVGLIITGLAACAPAGMDAGAPQNLNPTVVVVQYVTQVVTMPTQAPATATPLPPTAQPARIGYDPFSVQAYYPLKGCQIASRLRVGDRAVVGDTWNGNLGLHMSSDIGDAPLFRKLNPGEVVEVVGGPFCRTQGLVWEVLIGEDEHGYVAEGNGDNYWLLPTGEQVDKATMKEMKKNQALRMKLGVPADCLPR